MQIGNTACGLLCILLNQATTLLKCADPPQAAAPKEQQQQQQQLAQQFKQQINKSGLPQAFPAVVNTVTAQLKAAATDSVAALLPGASTAAGKPCTKPDSNTRSRRSSSSSSSGGGGSSASNGSSSSGSNGGSCGSSSGSPGGGSGSSSNSSSSSSWVDHPPNYYGLLVYAESMLRTFIFLTDSGGTMLVGPDAVAAAVDLALAALQHLDWAIKHGLGEVLPHTTHHQQQQQQPQQQQQRQQLLQSPSWLWSLFEDLSCRAQYVLVIAALCAQNEVCQVTWRCGRA
mgnify:CR=1 FL=1